VVTPAKTQAVVFDCDGTLLETESRWTMAEQAVCAAWDVEFSMELKHRLLGTHLAVSGEILADWVGVERARAPLLAQQLIEAYRAAVEEHGVEPMPGAVELVEWLAGRVPLVVASNTHLADTRRVLERSPLPEAFEGVVCAGDGIAPKPAPDLYLAACAAVGATPALTIALEDSPVGVASAKAAGLGVVYGIPADGVTLDADVVVHSLADIPPVRLLG
jgi:HAD superfamily hydrolase (TIGR01509 family)